MGEIKTKCKNCYFLTQYTCTLGRIELYCQNGGVYSEDNEGNPVIVGRFCSAKRDEKWYEKHKDNYLEELEKEITIKYGVIINSYDIINLTNAINYFEHQNIQPQAYYIVYNNENFSDKLDHINDILNKTNRRWQIKKPLEKPQSEFQNPNEYLVTGTIKEPFILYIKDTILPSKDLVEKINKTLNKELKQVMLFRDFDYIFMSTHLAKLLKLDRAFSEIIDAGHAEKIVKI